jgi:hypothetical protein
MAGGGLPFRSTLGVLAKNFQLFKPRRADIMRKIAVRRVHSGAMPRRARDRVYINIYKPYLAQRGTALSRTALCRHAVAQRGTAWHSVILGVY